MRGRAIVAVAAVGLLFPGAPEAGASDDAEDDFVVPEDTYFGEQWSLFNFGQGFGGGPPGTVDVDIRAPEAWAITQGDPSIVVAVLDTGVDRNHPDLAPNIWTNPAASASGRDDDANGFVDDTWGWDFVDGNNDPSDVRVADANTGRNAMAHGTAVASVIAAADDGQGMVGIAPGVQVMALRVIGEGLHDRDIADAIDYAAANGARIVNLSLATFVPGFGFPLTAEAIARHPDVLFVAGAGNSANDADTTRPEPCTLDVEHLICVAAYDEHGELAVFDIGGSNWGPTTVHLAAPGRGVLAARAPFETIWEDDLDGDVAHRWALDVGAGAWRPTVTATGDGLGVPTGTNDTTSARLGQPVDLADQHGCRLHLEVESAERGGLVTLEQSVDGQGWPQRVGARGLSLMGGTDGLEEYTVGLDDDLDEVWFGFQHHPSGGQAGDITLDRVWISCASDTYDGRNFGYAEGTSFATPLTAGVAALVLSEHPTLTPVQVRQAILDGARPLPGWEERTITGGGLDAEGALLEAARLAAGEGDVTQADEAGAPSSPGAGQGGWMESLGLPGLAALIAPPSGRSQPGPGDTSAAPAAGDSTDSGSGDADDQAADSAGGDGSEQQLDAFASRLPPDSPLRAARERGVSWGAITIAAVLTMLALAVYLGPVGRVGKVVGKATGAGKSAAKAKPSKQTNDELKKAQDAARDPNPGARQQMRDTWAPRRKDPKD